MALTDKLLAEKRAGIHKEAIRLAHIYFLRCGRIPERIKYIARETAPGNVTRKFNPNHDELGRFTFGSSGETDDQPDDNDNSQNGNSVSNQLGSLLQSLLGIGTAHAEDTGGEEDGSDSGNDGNNDDILSQPPAGKDPGSTSATYKDGSSIINPATGDPLMMPKGVSLANNVEIGKQLSDLPSIFGQNPQSGTYTLPTDFMPEKEAGMVALFWPGQPMDYQRTYSDNADKINPQYIDFGNYNYGVVAAAAGYTPEQTTTASGLYNLVKGGRDISGPMYNSVQGLKLITAGYNDYIAGRIGK